MTQTNLNLNLSVADQLRKIIAQKEEQKRQQFSAINQASKNIVKLSNELLDYQKRLRKMGKLS